MAQPIEPQIAPDETVFSQVLYQPTSGVEPLAVVVTDRAVSFVKNAFVGGRKWVRVEHGDVKAVAVAQTRTVGTFIAGALLFLVGAAATWGVYSAGEGIEGGMRAKHVAVPLMLAIGGLALPFLTRGRRRLEVKYQGGSFQWKPPMMVFKANRLEANQAIAECATAMRRAGHQVAEPRA
jgi:hypothetical protein